MTDQAHHYRCSHVISIDGEAPFLHGPCAALGAVVIDVVSERVVDQFAARLIPSDDPSSDFARLKGVADPWCLANIYPILEDSERWAGRNQFDKQGAMLLSFFLWWSAWSKSVPEAASRAASDEVSSEMAWLLRCTLEAAKSAGATKEGDAITVADWCYPVEAGMFSSVLSSHPSWGLLGPKPIHEIATLRLADSLANPTLGPTTQLDTGCPHDPLYDAEQSGMECVTLLKRLRKRKE